MSPSCLAALESVVPDIASNSVCLALQIFNMSSGLASMGNLAANLRGEGIYQFAASYGLAYRASKAALCMGEPCHHVREPCTAPAE